MKISATTTLKNWIFWLGLLAFFFFGDPKAPKSPNFGTVTKMVEVREDDKEYVLPLSKIPPHYKILRDAQGGERRVWDEAYPHYFIHTKEHGVIDVSRKDFIAVHNAHARQGRRFILIFGLGGLFYYFWRIRPQKKRRRQEELQRRIRELD